MFDISCTRCGRTQETHTEWRCACGGPFEIHNGAPFERDRIIRHNYSIWRYQKFLYPLESTSIISLGEGMTPLIPLDTAKSQIQAKLEYVSPTGSLKDRGVTVMVSHMKQQDVQKAIEDSSGNAGASVAAGSSIGSSSRVALGPQPLITVSISAKTNMPASIWFLFLCILFSSCMSLARISMLLNLWL